MKKILLPALLISLIALTILALPTNPIRAEDAHDHSNETPEEHAAHAGHEEVDHVEHDHEPQTANQNATPTYNTNINPNYRMYLWANGTTQGYNPSCTYNGKGQCNNTGASPHAAPTYTPPSPTFINTTPTDSHGHFEGDGHNH